jgi:hypothetical protein
MRAYSYTDREQAVKMWTRLNWLRIMLNGEHGNETPYTIKRR